MDAKLGVVLTIVAVLASSSMLQLAGLGLLPLFDGKSGVETSGLSSALAVLHVARYLVLLVSVAALAVDINGLRRDRSRWLLWTIFVILALWAVLNSGLALKLASLLNRA